MPFLYFLIHKMNKQMTQKLDENGCCKSTTNNKKEKL